MKIEGIIYFAGVALGILMLKLFYSTSMLLPKIVGMVFLLMGVFGYIAMLVNFIRRGYEQL